MNSFKSRYSLYLFRKYGLRAHLRENDLHLIELSSDEIEALERAIAYVQMNCVAAGICSHPSQYPWGTGNAFFQTLKLNSSGLKRRGKRLADISGRARKKLLHSDMDFNIPEEWMVSEAGYVLPESYVSVDMVERLYRNPNRLNYFLNSSSKARKRLVAEEDSLPTFKDHVVVQALPDLIQGLFRKSRFEDLLPQEQAELLRQIRFRFSANVHQAARVCGLSYADAARLIDSV